MYLLPIVAIKIQPIFIKCGWTTHPLDFDLSTDNWDLIINISTSIESGLLREGRKERREGREEGVRCKGGVSEWRREEGVKKGREELVREGRNVRREGGGRREGGSYIHTLPSILVHAPGILSLPRMKLWMLRADWSQLICGWV